MKKRLFLSGFTLIELMVTLAIAAILIAVASPSLNQFVSRNNASNTAVKLANVFAYARSEAVTRVENIFVCASNDGNVCVDPDDGGTDADWGDWWRVVTADGTLLKVENVSGLLVDFAVTDPGGINLPRLTSVCFNELGEECNGGFPFVIFTVSSDGETSSKRLNSSGSVSL